MLRKMEDDNLSTMGGLLALFLVMFSEQCYGAAAYISFLPIQAKEFISDTKEIVGLLTAVVILIIYIKKSRSKKEDKEEKEENG